MDGGVLLNYPIKLFDRKSYLNNVENGINTESYSEYQLESVSDPFITNTETLGFRIENLAQRDILMGLKPKRREVNNVYEFTKNLIGSILDFQQNVSLQDLDSDRTVYVLNTNKTSAVNFNITELEKNVLIESGFVSTETYFKSFDNPEIEMSNRPG